MQNNKESSPNSKTPARRVVKRSALFGGDKAGKKPTAAAAKRSTVVKAARTKRRFVLSFSKKKGPAAEQPRKREGGSNGNVRFYGGVIAAVVLVIAAAAILCSGILLPREYDILVNDAGRVVAASTTEKTVGEFLEKNSIVLGEGDVLAVSEDAELKDGFEIIIKRAFPVTITMGEQVYTIRMLAGTVQQAIEQAGIVLGEHDEVYPVADTLINAGTEITIIAVTEETIV